MPPQPGRYWMVDDLVYIVPVQDALLFYVPLVQYFLCDPLEVFPELIIGIDGETTLLLLQHKIRQYSLHCFLEDVLRRIVIYLHAVGDGKRELHEVLIEKRDPH